MRKFLKIHDIYLDFTYQFHDFFSDKLDKYEVCQSDFEFNKLSVYVKEVIELPKLKVKYQKDNRKFYETDSEEWIITYTFDLKQIKHLVYYKKDYSEIEIQLNSILGKRLAEYEYALSGMFFLDLAISKGYLPIHASCLSVNNFTFLLSGPSLSGKSTQTKFFKQNFKDTVIINEDKPLLFFKDDEVYVFGSPWSGKDVINTNVVKKVNALFFINQATKLEIENLTAKEKIRLMFKNTQRPICEELINNLSIAMDKAIDRIGIYKFNCINDLMSANFLYKFLEENYED